MSLHSLSLPHLIRYGFICAADLIVYYIARHLYLMRWYAMLLTADVSALTQLPDTYKADLIAYHARDL